MISCPNCNGNLKFDIKEQKMHCSFCDASFDPYDFDDKDADGVENSYETTIFTCPECAGEIESTDTDVTGFCPFCGASTIFYSRLQKELKPEFIIPFSKTKDDCKKIYQRRVSRAIFLPKEFKDSKYIDGFRGIYIPYWSYNMSQNGNIQLQGEKTHRSGDYIIHDHYNLFGDINSFYNGVSFDASSSFSDDISEKIAPFNVKEKKPFTAGFLSGFYADTADVSADTYKAGAKKFARDDAQRKVAKEFSSYSLEDASKKDFNTKIDKVERTMYPVWFMSYRHNDRVAYATINGQTGKMASDMPIDIRKYLLFSAGVSVLCFIFLNVFLTLKPVTVSLLTMLLGILSIVLYIIEYSKIRSFNSTEEVIPSKVEIKTAKEEDCKNKYKIPKIPIVCSVVAFIISGLCYLSGSIVDSLHYTGSAISAVLIAVTLMYLIKDYNLLTTRPLPQFAKKGGDDNA